MKKRNNISALIVTIFLVAVLSGISAYVNAQQTVKKKSSVFDTWKAGTEVSMKEVSSFGIANCFKAEKISDEIFRRMKGKSYPQGCSIPLGNLRYIKVLHYDIKGRILLGEMVCDRRIADDLTQIFRELFDNKYPIERMVLIDEYNADDETSMRANNSCAFCYRQVAGSKRISKHGYGLAVDINPLYNPYVKVRKNGTTYIQPSTAKAYTNRSKKFSYKITNDDLCYKLFIKHGFSWGGSWRSLKDYQHFEKKI